MDTLPSREDVQQTTDISRGVFLTVHGHIHIMDDNPDDRKRLSRGNPSLVLRESIERSQDCVDVLVSKEFLYEFN
jgi:hypothetical protein